jgi:hypothetical protein
LILQPFAERMAVARIFVELGSLLKILEVVALVDGWHVSDKDRDSKYCVDIFLVVVATI